MIKTERVERGMGVKDLSKGITAQEHNRIADRRGRPLTDGPISSVPHPSNPSRMIVGVGTSSFPARGSADYLPVSHLDKRRPRK